MDTSWSKMAKISRENDQKWNCPCFGRDLELVEIVEDFEVKIGFPDG